MEVWLGGDGIKELWSVTEWTESERTKNVFGAETAADCPCKEVKISTADSHATTPNQTQTEREEGSVCCVCCVCVLCLL